MYNDLNDTEEKEILIWDDLHLRQDLLRGIYGYGFDDPSPIQKKSIFPMIHGRDIIGHAQSGTGKTGSFSIGILQRIDLLQGTQALIVAPTHELVHQISKVVHALGTHMINLQITSVVGGTHVSDDVREISKKNPHIIIGTPGRMYDLLSRNAIDSRMIQCIVLDEADELLSDGFRTGIYNIFQLLNTQIQVALFTATLPDEILTLSDKFMRNPYKIVAKAEELNVEGIEHHFIPTRDDDHKFDIIKQLFTTLIVSQCIIYVNSVTKVFQLYQSMIDDGFSVSCIHGKLTKEERCRAFTEFSSGSSRMLISSNITARGIDIQQVGMVVNFDIPNDVHTYLHRVGRSGRHGRKGVAINLITRYDVSNLQSIEKYYKINISEFKL